MDTRHWRSKVSEDCSSLPASSSRRSSNQDFQSSISVEALFHRCHLDVQGLLHQQLLSSAMVQYGGLLQVDRVVVLPRMFRNVFSVFSEHTSLK